MTFHQWISNCFDHPMSDPAWYTLADLRELSDLSQKLALTYLTRLFKQTESCVRSYSDHQVNQGLWFLISPGFSPYIKLLLTQNDSQDGVSCIRSIGSLFAHYLLHKCTDELSNELHDVSLYRRSPLNSICYMFWDLIPWYRQGQDAVQLETFLAVIERILQLNHVACQESALHGLGHMFYSDPTRVRSIIDGFLWNNGTIRPDVRQYALKARKGQIA